MSWNVGASFDLHLAPTLAGILILIGRDLHDIVGVYGTFRRMIALSQKSIKAMIRAQVEEKHDLCGV
jgi:hypothetical protein